MAYGAKAHGIEAFDNEDAADEGTADAMVESDGALQDSPEK